MGTPPSSLNCLLGAFFLDFAAEGGAMRVPSPAAGTMTNTFIGGISIVQVSGFEPKAEERPAPKRGERFRRPMVSLKRYPDTKPVRSLLDPVVHHRYGFFRRVGRWSVGCCRGRRGHWRRHGALGVVAARPAFIPLAKDHFARG